MGSRRGVATFIFGVVLVILGIVTLAPAVPDLVFEDATAPTVIERKLSAGEWLIFENTSNGPSAVTDVRLTSSRGLTWNAQLLDPPRSLLVEEAQAIDTVDGRFLPVAMFELAQDDDLSVQVLSSRPTNIMLAPGVSRVNQLGVGVMVLMSGILVIIAGIVVIVVDNIRSSRKPKPGAPISRGAASVGTG